MVIKSSSAVIVGLLTFVSGILVGMLCAPLAGLTTRRRWQRRKKEIGDQAAEAIQSTGVEPGRSPVS